MCASTKTRTQTRTQRPFLAWVGYSQLKHAWTRANKIPGGKAGEGSPIPTLASISNCASSKELGSWESQWLTVWLTTER